MTLTRKPFKAMAEPNWTLFGLEGGLPNPQFDKWITCWCDLESGSTFAQSAASDGLEMLFGKGSITYEKGQEPDISSWCGYEWCANGTCWTIENGPEAELHWWEIDDLLWGAFGECLFAIRKPDGLLMTRAEIWDSIRDSSFCHPEQIAQGMCDYWQIP